MALVHEHLYQSRDLSKINFSEYIHNPVSQIFQAYEIKARGVKFNVKVGPILLNIDTSKINIKGKTTDNIGTIGSKEASACQTIISLSHA